MGDQLVSIDHLLSTIALINGHGLAERRISPKTILRSAHLIRDLKNSDRWFSRAFNKYASKAEVHLNEESAAPHDPNIPRRNDPVVLLRGNHHVWKVVHMLYNKAKTRLSHDLLSRYATRIKASAQSAATRAGASLSRRDISDFMGLATKNEHLVVNLTLIEALLWDTHTLRAHEHNLSCSRAEEGHLIHSEGTPCDWIDLLVFSDLVFIKIETYECIVTKVHFERIAKMIRSLIVFLLSETEWGLRVPMHAFIDDFFKLSKKLAEERPDYIGEVVKGARGILVAELDKSNVMGYRPVDAYRDELAPDRRYWAGEYSKLLIRSTRSPVAAINAANLFKIVPHPDANMEKLFRSIEGVRSPNSVDPELEARFEGMMRRMLYSSLAAQGYDVRVEATSDSGVPIQEATYATKRFGTKLRKMNSQAWSCTKFEKVRNLMAIDEITVKASSKSSQLAPLFSAEDLVESALFSGGDDVDEPDFIHKAGTVNDVVSEATGESHLDAQRAIERYIRIVELHEEFEERFLQDGIPVDQIPSEALEEFVMGNPEARNLVGTEPKFGEVHKEVTRMFYMAQQELKSITQRVERFTKQVCRKQPGVSITKSYPARRKDLESFCRNMIGKGVDKQSIFVSFDMSEFSKKFPMQLVRIFGKILSEIAGVDWLKRIDLVFRSSIVIHNSRGYFAHLAGVRGGFEGFFNFIWSSIHATVMEIALEATGLQGEILVFSDDGLLMFYAPSAMGPSEIRKRVTSIQRIYDMFGLKFNLGKTLISNHVWEYLGDICVDNHLVPMWIKELSSLTRNVKNRGLEPFYSKVKALQAQIDAAVAAGFDAMIGYLIKRYFFGCMIDRLGIAYNPRLEELLAVVPTSCGGLRITSPYEMMCLSTVEKDAEIIADLMIISSYDRNLVSTIMGTIKDRFNRKKDAARMIVSGSRLVTDHPDTSGMGVVNECVDLISSSAKVVVKVEKNPFSGTFSSDLLDLLGTLVNISLGVIVDFIYSTPSWTEYTNSMALVRSSGILRIVPRRTIQQLQAKDTRRVKDSINMWNQALTRGYYSFAYSSPSEFVMDMQERVFPGLSLAPLKPSPRIALLRSPKNQEIEVRIEADRGVSFYDQEYPEPIMKMSKDETTLFWTSEAGGTTQTRSIRKFVNSVAKVLSHSPEMEGAIINITKLLGFEMPPIPPGFAVGAHRRGKGMHHTLDVKVNLPRWFMTRTEARYVGPISDYVYDLRRGDRTTYLEAARCLAYSIMRTESKFSNHVDFNVGFIYFQVDPHLWEVMHETYPMEALRPFNSSIPLTVISDNLKREFESSLYEYRDAMTSQSKLLELSNIAIDAEDYELDMVMDLYKSAVKRWLISFKQSEMSTLIHSFDIPLPSMMVTEILQSAALNAALQTMAPQMRRRLIDRVNEWLTEKTPEEYAQFNPVIENSEPLMALYNELVDYFEILESAVPEEFTLRLPSLEYGIPSSVMMGLSRYVTYTNLFANPRIVVVRSNSSIYGKITAAHRTAFKEAFTSTLSGFIHACRKVNWDPARLKELLNTPLDPDLIITCLTICRELLRDSEHRALDKPYNPTSVIIHLFKLSCFLKRVYELADADEERDPHGRMSRVLHREMLELFVEDFRLTDEEAGYIQFQLRLNSEDVDHMNMIHQGIMPEMRSRAVQEVAAGRAMWNAQRRLRYPSSATELRNILTSFHRLITGRAVNALVEYNQELEQTVLEHFSPSSPSIVRLASLSTDAVGILGRTVDLAGADDGMRADAIALLQAHLRDYLLRNRVKGVKMRRGMSQIEAAIAGAAVTPDGLDIALYNPDHVESVDIHLYFLCHIEYTKAISDYVLLSSIGSSSVSVFKDVQSGFYYVTGAVEAYCKADPNSSSPEISYRGDYQLIDFIPCLTIRGEAALIRSRHAGMMVSNTAPILDFRRIQTMARKARRVDRSSQVEEDSLMLMGAYNLINGSIDHEAVSGAYVGIIMWIRGVEDVNAIPDYAAAVRRKFESMSRAEKASLTHDISLTITWLMQLNLSPGINMPHSLLVECTDSLRRCAFPAKISVTATVARIRPLREVKDELVGKRNIIGTISGYLYQVDQIPLLENVFDELDAEGKERIEKIIEDL